MNMYVCIRMYIHCYENSLEAGFARGCEFEGWIEMDETKQWIAIKAERCE